MSRIQPVKFLQNAERADEDATGFPVVGLAIVPAAFICQVALPPGLQGPPSAFIARKPRSFRAPSSR
jgi:hypothetical protein